MSYDNRYGGGGAYADYLGTDPFSPFLDSRDGVYDESTRAINDAIRPLTREGLNIVQPPIGSIMSQALASRDAVRLSAEPVPRDEMDDDQRFKATPQAVYISSEYGDMIFLPFTFLGGESQLCLQRAKGARQSFVIQNNLPQLSTNLIIVSFGIPAAPGNGIQIPAGGNWYVDRSTPQNEIYIYAPVAGSVIVGFVNVNPPAPSKTLA